MDGLHLHACNLPEALQKLSDLAVHGMICSSSNTYIIGD